MLLGKYNVIRDVCPAYETDALVRRVNLDRYTAKFVIEKKRMYVENANRAAWNGVITPDNLEPNPKNPLIASFFRNIGWSDRLGSGVRNLFKYSKYYSGEEPEFVEGDVFRIIVPLEENYSYDAKLGENPDTMDTKPDINQDEFFEANIKKKYWFDKGKPIRYAVRVKGRIANFHCIG